jgi:AcrR family transcriptional regulator
LGCWDGRTCYRQRDETFGEDRGQQLSGRSRSQPAAGAVSSAEVDNRTTDEPGRRAPAPGRRGTRRRVDREAEFVEAAMAVIRREGPGASMDQIAAEAGVSKPILYRHFTDRAGLVEAVGRYSVAHVNDELLRSMRSDEGSTRELIYRSIDTYLRFIEADPEIYRFLVHQSVIDDVDSTVVMTDYIRQTGRQVAVALAELLRESDLDASAAEPWAFGIVGMVHVAGDWWTEGGSMTRDQLCTSLTSLLADGLPFTDEPD